MSARSDLTRPSPLALVGMAAALALAWANGLATREYHLGIGDGPYRGDYFTVTGVCLGTATVLALGLVALAVLRAPWWLQVASAAAAGHHAVLAVSAYQLAGSTAPNRRFPGGSINEGAVDALMPGSWPLLVVVVAGLFAVVCHARSRVAKSPGRLAITGISASFVLAAVSGVVGWYFRVVFTFMDDAEPADYQAAILTAAATAVLLLVGALVVRMRWGTWFQLLPAGFGVLVQAFVVGICVDGALGAPDPDGASELGIRFSLETAALLPTTWPLLLVLVWAVVTATPGLRRDRPGAGRVDPWTRPLPPVPAVGSSASQDCSSRS